MSWFFDLPLKQKFLFVLVVAGVIVVPIFASILARNIRNGRETERQSPETAMEAPMQKVTLSGRDGVALSQETYYNMGQEDGNAYFLAPAGSEAKVSLAIDSGRGIGLLRVTGKEAAVAYTLEGTMITFTVPDTDCIVEAVGIDAPEGGGIYGAASEYNIDVFGLTEDLLGLFAGKYNKASLISAFGIAMESASGNKAVKSLTFTGQEVTTESRNGRICLLALVNADEARRVLVYFDTASGAFSFTTSVEEDRDLGLKEVNKEPSASPTPVRDLSGEDSETTSSWTEEPDITEKPTPKPTPTPGAAPMLKVTPTPTNIPTPKATLTPTNIPTPTNTPTPKLTNTPTQKPTNTPTPKAAPAPKKTKNLMRRMQQRKQTSLFLRE